GLRYRRVGGARFRCTEDRRGQTGKEKIRGTEQVLIGDRDDVVEGPIDRTQTDWKLRVAGARPGCARRRDGRIEVDLIWSSPEEHATGRVGLADFDRVEDEPKIFGVDDKSVSDRCGLRTDGSHRVQSQ